MKLVLAEKPSVAQSIAKVLGAAKREDGYLEGNGYVVSWCVGHLVELAQPEVYDAKSGYSKKFFEKHRQEITIHKAAKQAFDELQITKLPSSQSLYEEFHQLAVQKKQDYAEYRQIRNEKEELLIAKRTVETILNIDRQKEQEKEQEKEEKKNFR